MPARIRYTGPAGWEQPLPRGDVTEGVVRVGETVRRPHRPGSDAVADYLGHLESRGFDRVPRYLGRDDDGRDVLDFLDGEVPGAVLPDWATTDEALAGVGELTALLHRASGGWDPDPPLAFPRDLDGTPAAPWPPDEPRSVQHNDITPQNTVFRDGRAWGFIDFDLAGRTGELTDLANAAMHWVPLCAPVDRVPVRDDDEIARRLRLFLDAYGLPHARRAALLDAAGRRFAGLPESMAWRAEHLGGGWARMWADGVGDLAARRARWFAAARPVLAAAIGAPVPSVVDAALTRARQGWERVDARTAADLVARGAALLVDTRTEVQRGRTGELPGAVVIDRTVLEWRLDPTAPTAIPEAHRRPRLIVVCRQGFSSSFAARALRDLGLDATDMVDGVEGWLAAGLPLVPGPADVRE